MSSFQEVPSSANALQTSNFAHVIFQNVAKSYLPNTHLECHYTLTQFIHPHQKDWVGIFKVGWSTARDYYTFLWSPMPENYVEGSTVNCVLNFQGYYLPNDDGEFYQFCYVTHKGEIRGASTPFQFRTSSPVEELLTMEDEGNSDMLVVTTKAGLLEFKIEKIVKEKEELLKVTSVLEKETAQLRDQVERLEKELNLEKQRCDQLQTEQKTNIQASETLKIENDDLKKKHDEVTSKVLQLEEDIMTVTQKAIAKETELDSMKDKLKKVMLEKDQLECVIKTEKDVKELYKEDAAILKEQLRKAEDQIQASKQEAVLMSKELSDAVNVRDKTMADLHSARLENEKLKKQLADALAELKKITALKNEQVQLAEKERRIKELASQLELFTAEKELGKAAGNQAGRMMEGQISQPTLHFRNPYSEENGPVPAVPSRLPVLQYGNPYAIQERRDGADGAFNPDEIQRPPARTSFWELEDDVVCSQPSRNLSRPDGLEDPEDSNDDDNAVPSAPDPPSLLLHERGTGFCFDSSFDVHKKCPLCDVMFPPNYDQSKFEEHVESHWKVCPMCSEQFPPDYDQQGEKV
uniref:Tax1 binding protein 1 n=1 Tax=Coturnix japonica TaxID=93934 RepID=A0A8C2TP16_COTJA